MTENHMTESYDRIIWKIIATESYGKLLQQNHMKNHATESYENHATKSYGKLI